MRKYMILCSVLMAAMILLPLTVMEKQHKTVIVSSEKTASDNNIVSVMKSENGKIDKIDVKEYTIGALAAEMEMNYHEEALKAQAVACYTYALYCKENADKSSLNGADISDDSKIHQGYFDKDARKKKWGDNFNEYEKKAEKIVDEIYGKKITYNGKPILAAYHDLCSGKTESAKTVWGEDIPYLQSVVSSGDKLSPNYEKTVSISPEKFKSSVQIIDGIVLPNDKTEWVGEADKSDSGFVRTLQIGGTKVNGGDLKKALGLSSRNFSIEFSDNGFLIRTVGNGHMVGMSQYGADYMARQGSDWQEILKHYYIGVNID